MNQNEPSVTVLIAARPDQAEVKAVAAGRVLDYPADKLEVIVARGKQPSVQRNAALKVAGGDLVYFLDDDSIPHPETLRRAAKHFADPQVKMVGGPNLCPAEAPPLEQVFALVLGSWLAFSSSRARYCPVGGVRQTSEKELILCNLVARRAAMLELGGFNEALYPNEENALMDELQNRGGKLIYDPDVIVHRRPRSSLPAFARMLKTYGRGRAEQFRVNPTLGSAANFVPPLFLVYLVALPFLLTLVPRGGLFLVPLALYALLVLGQTAILVGRPPSGPRTSHLALRTSEVGLGDRILRGIAAGPLIVLTHLLYGYGFWRGLFTKLKSPGQGTPPPVTLEVVAPDKAGPSSQG